MKQNSVESGFINAGAAGWIPPTTTFASAPQSPATGSVYLFTDALTLGAIVGGGTSLSTCRWSGSAWVSVGAGPATTIQDEGTPLTQRASLNFVGAGVTATDDSNNGRTVVTIPGASQTPWTQDINAAGFKLYSTGNVGIGNTAVTLPDVDAAIHLIVGGDSAATGELTAATTTASAGVNVGLLNFANYNLTAADKRIACILGFTDGSKDSGAISFNTWNAGVFGERMRITAAGIVSVGRSTPYNDINHPVQVHVASDFNLLIGYSSSALWMQVLNDATSAFKPLVIAALSYRLINLPSTNPGAGSGQIWYDPADGNRVKYTG